MQLQFDPSHFPIHTKRLLLRPVNLEDQTAFFKMDSNPNVLRYLKMTPLKTLKDSYQDILHIQKQYADLGTGRLAIELKETGECIGWAGLKYIVDPINEHTDYLDLGYRLQEEHWGKGYGTEAALASLQYGFDVLNAPVIRACCQVEHQVSRRILENIGLRCLDTFMFYGNLHYWLELKKEDYGREL